MGVMPEPLTLSQAASSAASTFRLFEEGSPDLRPFGFRRIDAVLGGDEPGQLSIVAGMTGLGKSRAMLTGMMATGTDGAVLLEDGLAATGARVLGAKTGIDSLRIRRKDLSPRELARVKAALSDPRLDAVRVVDCVAGTLEKAQDAVRALADAGCRRVWVDYLQKIRGVSDERRDEVGRVMTGLQRVAHESGVALTLVSQFKRAMVFRHEQWVPACPWDRPLRSWLKESGDIENEARTILFIYQAMQGMADLRVVVDKASYGGEGTSTILRPDSAGTLFEVQEGDAL